MHHSHEVVFILIEFVGLANFYVLYSLLEKNQINKKVFGVNWNTPSWIYVEQYLQMFFFFNVLFVTMLATNTQYSFVLIAFRKNAFIL